ncbi:MAG: ClbS/DfsB family four-helix bundle protein [Anaerolineae bacterium]|nr:ClbS/DfsB family four-helix bundle protein [Anaerolineae bacterium]MDK1117739.1 ClbS/DfsB family four-helix bundle protein [Anaerolineae bacterium]
MPKITLRQVRQDLEQGWGEYINKFNALSPTAQATFLKEEGFERFRDLLAHIIGWWEESLWIINIIVDDPSFPWEERDTDTFNQELVEKYQSWSEQDLLLYYEKVRLAMLDLATQLPESALMNKDIHDWLSLDVIEHLQDHKIA